MTATTTTMIASACKLDVVCTTSLALTKKVQRICLHKTIDMPPFTLQRVELATSATAQKAIINNETCKKEDRNVCGKRSSHYTTHGSPSVIPISPPTMTQTRKSRCNSLRHRGFLLLLCYITQIFREIYTSKVIAAGYWLEDP